MDPTLNAEPFRLRDQLFHRKFSSAFLLNLTQTQILVLTPNITLTLTQTLISTLKKSKKKKYG